MTTHEPSLLADYLYYILEKVYFPHCKELRGVCHADISVPNVELITTHVTYYHILSYQL